MVESLSYWTRETALAGLALAVALLATAPSSVHAQDDDLSAACAALDAGPRSECALTTAAVRLIHPRVGTGLWGGSPVPGSASTLGLRLGSFPRFSLSGRTVLLPMELPPLTERDTGNGERALTMGLSGQATVGILPGWSPLPTVGGFLSLDAIARTSWLHLPGGQGFEDGGVLGGSVGLRLGILRESLTLPAISLTGSYGRSTEVTFGDAIGATPEGGAEGGHIESGIGNWSLSGAITKRVGPVGVTAGAALDRYTGAVDYSYAGGPVEAERADVATDRWSAFGNLSWTFLILSASLEAGWQESPIPAGLPSDVSLEPTGWWAGLAVRISI